MAQKGKGKSDVKPAGSRKQANASMEAQRRRQQAFMKLGVIGGGLVLFVAFVFQMQFGKPSGVPMIALNETDMLKEVFFGGQPWVIQCAEKSSHVDSTVAAAAPVLAANAPPYSVVQTAAVPCAQTLPSGKTVYQRFKLDRSIEPLVLLFVNGNKPQVVPTDYLRSTRDFVKRVSDASKVKISQVVTPSTFGRACLSKNNKVCVIVLPFTDLTAEHNASLLRLAGAHRTMQFAVVNTNSVELSVERSLPKLDNPEPTDMVRVVATRVFPDNSAQALAYRGDFTEGALGQWINDIASGEQELNMISKKPSAMRRRRHRDPNEDPATRAEKKKQRKEARKAAEEAIRQAEAEMLAKLTPEERAEREEMIKQKRIEWERKRREQMEQEADSIFDDDDDYDDDDDIDEDDDDEMEAEAADYEETVEME